MEFKNRESTHKTRRRIKIISQNASEIIADIERDEALEGVLQQGTPLSAETFNTLITINKWKEML